MTVIISGQYFFRGVQERKMISLSRRLTIDLLAILLCCVLLLAACGSTRQQTTHEAKPGFDEQNLRTASDIEQARQDGNIQIPDKDDKTLIPNIAPCWQLLAARLKADGISGPKVDALLATLGTKPTQSPMGRKIRELYRRHFLLKPPAKPAPQYYKGVVTVPNAALCRDYIDAHKADFAAAESRYGVSPAIAASLLFVETRLGKVLGDIPDNAFYTLASMAVSNTPQDIGNWLVQLPGYQKHMPWLMETLHKRADWAYRETKALIDYMLRNHLAPDQLPGSIYGAVGLCQFMPSSIAIYGADGNGDGRVDLFTASDAIASLANYLALHGWKKGLSRERQYALLMTYNHSRTYANTILALGDLVMQTASPPISKVPVDSPAAANFGSKP